MIASVLKLNRRDCLVLKITDVYSIHRIVYDLFPDVRSEDQKKSNIHSGILFADKGEIHGERVILILADREPNMSSYGTLEIKQVPEAFLKYKNYGFEVVINPTKREKKTGKTIPVLGRDNLIKWFSCKAEQSWGFKVDMPSLSVEKIKAITFIKKENQVTLNSAVFKGRLSVTEQDKFICSFNEGIGRARGFGFGFLQLVPLQTNI